MVRPQVLRGSRASSGRTPRTRPGHRVAVPGRNAGYVTRINDGTSMPVPGVPAPTGSPAGAAAGAAGEGPAEPPQGGARRRRGGGRTVRPPARAGQPRGRSRAGGRRPVRVLLAPVADAADQFGRCGERAAGVGHAARQPAAARLAALRRLLLHHRTAAVHADRGGTGARPRGGQPRRGDDLHAAGAAGGPAREGRRGRPGRAGPLPAGRGDRAGAAAQRHLDAAAGARSHRYGGGAARGLAGDRPGPPALAGAGGGIRDAGLDHGGRLHRAADRHRADRRGGRRAGGQGAGRSTPSRTGTSCRWPRRRYWRPCSAR